MYLEEADIMARHTFKPRTRIDPRFLRSDGKPNFTNRVYEKARELEYIMRKHFYKPTPTEPIGRVIKHMTQPYGRRMPICRATGEIEGVVTSSDVVSYLGGGEYYNIVLNRHGDSIYSALEEPISTIMSREVIYSSIEESLVDLLEKMVVYGVGIIPVVGSDGRVLGVVSERDIVENLAEKKVGVRISEVMSSAVVTVARSSTIKRAAETMLRYGYRRLPVVEGEEVVGVVTTLDIIRLYSSNKAFKYTSSGRVGEVLKVPVYEIFNTKVPVVPPDADVGEGVDLMLEEDVDFAIVASEGRMVGLLTERDVLIALSLRG